MYYKIETVGHHFTFLWSSLMVWDDYYSALILSCTVVSFSAFFKTLHLSYFFLNCENYGGKNE